MRLLAPVVLLHLAAAAVAAQTPAAPAAPDTAASRPRRQPVTPEHERTAFADPGARVLLERARGARLAQDSALRGYEARAYHRHSVGFGIRHVGRERLLMRHEQAARVRWARGSGVWVEPMARRATAMAEGEFDADLSGETPIPYFPGRETLWFPGRPRQAREEVNEDALIHPLATGAEAYYRYASGDSVSMRLPDGRVIALRELKVTARRPDWRAIVGSFWFDVERGSLVRGSYRLAADLDVWTYQLDRHRRRVDSLAARARTDTGAAAARARREADSLRIKGFDRVKLTLAQGVVSPWRQRLTAVTTEYGLYEGRFWLPKVNVAEGELQFSVARAPQRIEESFRYTRVNGDVPVPAVRRDADDTVWVAGNNRSFGLPLLMPKGADSSLSARAARADSLHRRYTFLADSARAVGDSARRRGDSATVRRLAWQTARYDAAARQLARWREGCAAGDSTFFAGFVGRDSTVVRAVRLPCNPSRLAASADLPGSIYDDGRELFDAADRDELLRALGLGLQPGWGPRAPAFRTGVDLVRYNRIEGLSLGASATSALGLGYTAQAVARFGLGDRVPNGELSLARSNGRADVRLGVYRRLAVANDDWGAPLSFGASLANLLYARDEGFYYRTLGAELSGTRAAPGPLGATLGWRVFAERQRTAGREPNTQASLGDLFGNPRFGPNVEAERLTAFGAGGDLARGFGVDPAGLRLATRLRGEGALTARAGPSGTTGYGRLLLDGTLSRGVGPFAAAFTAAVGGSVGHLPTQRSFHVGGLQTVRGQFARPEGPGRVGDAFWLARGEVALGRSAAVRPALFHDIGWAGPRADFARRGAPLSGAGVGVSFLDGLFRVDLSRGLRPEKKTRLDLYLEARF